MADIVSLNVLPSCSSLGVFMRCPASRRLARIDTRGDVQKKGMERGTNCHKFMENVVKFGRDDALSKAPDDLRQFLSAINLKDVWPDGQPTAHEVEVAMAYSISDRSVKLLGNGLDRDYSNVDRHVYIVGTADLAMESNSVVADYKFTNFSRYAPDPDKSDQLMMLGSMYMLLSGKESVNLRTIKIDDDARVRIVRHDFDELSSKLYESIVLLKTREAPGADFHTGAWCDDCRSFSLCEAKTSMIRALSLEPKVIEMTEENAPLIVEKLIEYKRVVDALQTQVDAYAANNPVKMKDGRTYGPKTTTRRSIPEVDQAVKVLGEMYDADRAAAMVVSDKKITIDSITKVLGTHKEAERALGELQRHGLVAKKKTDGIGIS